MIQTLRYPPLSGRTLQSVQNYLVTGCLHPVLTKNEKKKTFIFVYALAILFRTSTFINFALYTALMTILRSTFALFCHFGSSLGPTDFFHQLAIQTWLCWKIKVGVSFIFLHTVRRSFIILHRPLEIVRNLMKISLYSGHNHIKTTKISTSNNWHKLSTSFRCPARSSLLTLLAHRRSPVNVLINRMLN